jgi:hypothetical protein
VAWLVPPATAQQQSDAAPLPLGSSVLSRGALDDLPDGGALGSPLAASYVTDFPRTDGQGVEDFTHQRNPHNAYLDGPDTGYHPGWRARHFVLGNEQPIRQDQNRGLHIAIIRIPPGSWRGNMPVSAPGVNVARGYPPPWDQDLVIG